MLLLPIEIHGIPKWLLRPSVFVEAWDAKANNHTFARKYCLFALPPKAAGPKNNYFPENVWCFGIVAPGLQETTWPKNHFGIPLMRYGFMTGGVRTDRYDNGSPPMSDRRRPAGHGRNCEIRTKLGRDRSLTH